MQPAPRRLARFAEAPPLVSMKTALAAFLKSSGLDAVGKYPQIEAAWFRIVGPEFAGRTRVLGFRKGVVQIGVASSALMSDIRFHQVALLGDLRREVRRPAISGISFSVAPIRESDDGLERT
jgi:hypothetical protein